MSDTPNQDAPSSLPPEAARKGRPRSLFGVYARVLRIPQWIKNGYVFLPIFFCGLLFDGQALANTLLAFFSFCGASSFIYILNDIKDIEADRQHPVKRFRPLAHGDIGVTAAKWCAGGCLLAALGLALLLGLADAFCIVGAYVVLNLFYIAWAKQKAILDITCIAIGFVLRTFAGAAAIGQPMSHWLVLMVFLLAMFLAFGKRWDDLSLAQTGVQVRSSLSGYSKSFALAAMTFFSGINTICYIMYTVDPAIIGRYHAPSLYLTTFWVILGNLRYLQLAFVLQNTMSPTRILLHDRGIQTCLFCWVLHLGSLLYC